MRSLSVWKGSLSFGLVNINIELYTAIKSHSFGFKLLHSKCHGAITYERWCDKCNEEVDWNNIVKGLKLEDGTYFIVTKENLDKLKPQKTDYINIIEFIDSKALEPIYFDQHYYIAPAKVTDKAFFLFAKILEKLDKIAIGQFVMRDKEYVCAIQSFRNSLLLTTLHYEYEVKQVLKIEELQVFKTLPEELKLAGQLVQKLSVKKFDMSKFKDSFEQELVKKIKQFAKGVHIATTSKVATPKVVEHSLVGALQASLKNKKPVAKAKKVVKKPVVRAKKVSRAKAK
ncbi:MAG: Ku protein [Candidatus Babeliales bacterium]|nr:Ku protein [Candidatus Babeliales bacterium]